MIFIFIFIFIFICSFLLSTSSVSCKEKQAHIVYFGEYKENKTLQEEARSSLIYSYKHNMKGFAAFEASSLSGFVSVLESHYSPQTTRSWDFMGLRGLNEEIASTRSSLSVEKDLLRRANYGKHIIVGILDSGIWPESQSFNDEGMTSPPQSWKGSCNTTVDFNSSCCNSKIIGAKYYIDFFEKELGHVMHHKENIKSPRDLNGHGTHIASIIAGSKKRGVEALGGLASGIASGGAPMSHIAIYKVCWNRAIQLTLVNDCALGDILKAIHDAISDGVHVINLSISPPTRESYDKDVIAIGALHAIKNDVVVICAAGNKGPNFGTVDNVAPWVITVGAGSIDRMFVASLTLGNGNEITGQSVAPYNLSDMYSLVYAGDVERRFLSNDAKGKCLDGSLLPQMVKGKIVLCTSDVLISQIEASAEVESVGGIGIIIGDTAYIGVEVPLSTCVIPAIIVTTSDALIVYNYIKSTTSNAKASIGFPKTLQSDRPSPAIAIFSGRGPSIIDPHIIKPDLIAPGLNILGAWSEESSPSLDMDDDRRVKYKIESGTSMAAPHVASVVCLLKAAHPKWSSAAIKSALMTSASVGNNMESFISDYNNHFATPYIFGSGHLMPSDAVDPGLVYDISFTEYLTYLCSIGHKNLATSFDLTFNCPEIDIPPYHLNYPSLAISNKEHTLKVPRTVTNVGDPNSTYVFVAKIPDDFSIRATPFILRFDQVGQKISFQLTFKVIDTTKIYPQSTYAYGWYAWSDGSHFVRSPIVISLA